MLDYAAETNNEAGRLVDTITVDMGMAVLCKLKSVDFGKRVEVSFSTVKAGWSKLAGEVLGGPLDLLPRTIATRFPGSRIMR